MRLLCKLLLMFSCFQLPLSKAEDIELYVKHGFDSNEKTRVLVVFDTSGSMAFSSVTGADCGYNWSIGRWNLCTNHRLGIARNALYKIVDDNEDFDFGLMRFSPNNKGGFVVAGIGASQSVLNEKIGQLEANGGTPLSETLWEAYLYITGQSTKYAQANSNRDTSIESSSTYTSPFTPQLGKKRCDNTINVIVMTDGDPTVDSTANSNISSLYSQVFSESGSDLHGNYMPMLASAMSGVKGGKRKVVDLYDTGDSIDNIVNLYTIGFGTGMSANGVDILEQTALNGGGQYTQANTASELVSSFERTINLIDQKTSSFLSPSVSTNSKDHTQTGDSLYYTMFYPEKHSRWIGNLKKLKVKNGKIVDLNNKVAINDEGSIDKNATTFWSATTPKNGSEIKKGGVRNQLAQQISRKIFSNFNSDSLQEFTYEKAVSSYGEATLAAHLGSTTVEAENIINWAIGKDVNDEDKDGSSTDRREDIFGDPLHSRPVSMDYGENNIRIILGTNAGMLHMFRDRGDKVEESWAFIPGSLLPIIKPLKDRTEGSKLYGMDGPVTVHFDDKNKDGTVNGDDKVWLFAGMRRGGNAYFAFDITNPDSPKLMWTISNTSAGFSELGQTWSKPIVTNISSHVDKPVLVFGAGYDTNKDQANRSNDSKGRGLYIVEAQTGKLAWALTPGSGNVSYLGKHSIAAELSLLDTDYDGFTDRIYAADTAGGVWRIDMPEKSPTHNVNPWTHFPLADLGANDKSNDRRFFYKPIVARTVFSKVVETNSGGVKTYTRHDTPYDAIVVGSGDRTNPLGKDTQNYLFSIRDENTRTRSFKDPSDYNTIRIDDLYDISNEPFATVSNSLEKFNQVEAELGKFKGWKYRLRNGEKSLAKATVYDGVVYFTSFKSEDTSVDSCSLTGGSGSVYALHLHYGSKIYDQLRFDTVSEVPDTPTIFRYNSTDGDKNKAGNGGLILSVKGNDDSASTGPGKSGDTWKTQTIVGPLPTMKDGKVVTSESSANKTLKTNLLYIYPKERNDKK